MTHSREVEVAVAEGPIPEAAPTDNKQLSMAEFVASLPGAPTTDQITSWKAQAPNGRIRAYAPDAAVNGKRTYILRGLTGLEFTQIQKQIQSMATPAADPDLEVQIASVVRATLWTNVGSNGGKLTDVILRTGAAGTPSALFAIITELSDFADPQKLEFLSADL